MGLTVSRRTLSRRATLSLLDDLAEQPKGQTLYLLPNSTHPDIEKHLAEIAISPDILSSAADTIEKSATGAAVFWSVESKCLILPPFPVTETTLVQGFLIEPLKSRLTEDYTIGIVLVRLGAYAVGVAHSENIITSKVGTGNVHGQHRKGGSSAHRFERHRDKQIEYFFTRLCAHAREHIEPHIKELDYLVYGGARTTIRELLKQCSFLERLSTPTLPPLLDIPEPRQAVLDTALRRVYSSVVLDYQVEGED